MLSNVSRYHFCTRPHRPESADTIILVSITCLLCHFMSRGTETEASRREWMTVFSSHELMGTVTTFPLSLFFNSFLLHISLFGDNSESNLKVVLTGGIESLTQFISKVSIRRTTRCALTTAIVPMENLISRSKCLDMVEYIINEVFKSIL